MQMLPSAESELANAPAVELGGGATAPPEPVDRTRIALVLALLLVVHLVVRLKFNPAARNAWPLFSVLEGIYVGQPFLVAMVAVFAPLRRVVRLALAAAIWIAVVLWECHGVVFAYGFILAFSLALPATILPYWSVYRVRRWRVQLGNLGSDAPATEAQFSLRTLMIVLTGSCLLLAAGRGVYALVKSPDDWANLCGMCFVVTFAFSVAATLTVPCVGLALSTQKRRQFLLWTIGSCLFAMTLIGVTRGAERSISLACAYASVIATLLALRWCGFRLVRIATLPGDESNSAQQPVSVSI